MAKTYSWPTGIVQAVWLLMLSAGLSPFYAADGSPPEQASGLVRFLDLQAPVPRDWRQAEPASSMRLAQFTVDGRDPQQSAEIIFYFFGQGQGGTPEANIARWQSQFHAADGGVPEPVVARLEVSGMPVTRVQLQGSYARGVGAGPGGAGKPGQTLIAALVETPGGQVIIQLHGDTELVDSVAPDFDEMLRGIRPVSR